MRRVLTVSLLILAAAFAGGASAQQAKPRPRPVLQPPVAALTTAPAQSPVPRAPSRPVTPSRFDEGPTCRAQCSKDRYACHGEDDATDCDTRWLSCLSTCRAR